MNPNFFIHIEVKKKIAKSIKQISNSPVRTKRNYEKSPLRPNQNNYLQYSWNLESSHHFDKGKELINNQYKTAKHSNSRIRFLRFFKKPDRSLASPAFQNEDTSVVRSLSPAPFVMVKTITKPQKSIVNFSSDYRLPRLRSSHNRKATGLNLL